MSADVPPNPFKPVKRIVTGHNSDGKAVFIFEDELNRTPMGSGDGRVLGSRVWVTKESPADNSDNKTDTKDFTPARFKLIETNGSHTFVLEVAPGAGSPRHRTRSIDYVILISGEITLVLDDGVERTVTEPGSIIVERGTMHHWINRSSAWAKVVIVLIDAGPVQGKDGEGKVVDLPEEFVTSKDDSKA